MFWSTESVKGIALFWLEKLDSTKQVFGIKCRSS